MWSQAVEFMVPLVLQKKNLSSVCIMRVLVYWNLSYGITDRKFRINFFLKCIVTLLTIDKIFHVQQLIMLIWLPDSEVVRM